MGSGEVRLERLKSGMDSYVLCAENQRFQKELVTCEIPIPEDSSANKHSFDQLD